MTGSAAVETAPVDLKVLFQNIRRNNWLSISSWLTEVHVQNGRLNNVVIVYVPVCVRVLTVVQ